MLYIYISFSVIPYKFQAQSDHGNFPTPDDDIPMVDKIVDASWNKEASDAKPAISKGPYSVMPFKT